MQTEITALPDRGRSMEMPPREPLMYRLYEIVQNYGYAYKAVLNEHFGDGIMRRVHLRVQGHCEGLLVLSWLYYGCKTKTDFKFLILAPFPFQPR